MRDSLSNQTEEGSDYHDVARAEAVHEGKMTVFKIKGRRFILTRNAGHLFAFDAACPHAAADLAKGSLRRGQVCCHEHDYCFDLRSGRIVWPEDELYRLKMYEVMEVDGIIKVKMNA